VQETKSIVKIVEMARVDHQWLSLNAFWEIGDSALINTTQDISAKHDKDEDLPASFVPGRNLVFLSLAGAYAYKHGIRNIVIGASQTDYSGYPDCRDETIQMMGLALTFGLGKGMFVETPLMNLTKARTVHLAASLPGCMEALAYSHTCYEGQYPPCGICPACVIRADGFEKANERDPLIVRYYSEV
jgi:7-cyano-7-deazaguanine synthase